MGEVLMEIKFEGRKGGKITMKINGVEVPVGDIKRHLSPDALMGVGLQRIGNEVVAEVMRAAEKHGRHAMASPSLSMEERLPIVVEEAGEVAQEVERRASDPWPLVVMMEALGEVGRGMTYDGSSDLRTELVQLAAMATAWVYAIDQGARQPLKDGGTLFGLPVVIDPNMKPESVRFGPGRLREPIPAPVPMGRVFGADAYASGALDENQVVTDRVTAHVLGLCVPGCEECAKLVKVEGKVAGVGVSGKAPVPEGWPFVRFAEDCMPPNPVTPLGGPGYDRTDEGGEPEQDCSAGDPGPVSAYVEQQKRKQTYDDAVCPNCGREVTSHESHRCGD
jgi:hypothetical protein